MSADKSLKGLTHLLTLREREKERLQTEVAAKHLLAERFEQNISKLETLSSNMKPHGGSVIHSVNAAIYKHTMKQLAYEQQQDLALHRKDMQVSQDALVEAAQKREAINKILVQKRYHLAKARSHAEQKRTDEMASQVWARGRE
jgi:flagellar export protein FliJ